MALSNVWDADVLRSNQYDILEQLAPGVYKISRKRDKIEYLAHDLTGDLIDGEYNPGDPTSNWTVQLGLLRAGNTSLLRPIFLILNHDNLVSLKDWYVSRQVINNEERHFAVWDYCNAGNLGNLLVKEPIPIPTGRTVHPGGGGDDDDDDSDVDDEEKRRKLDKLERETFLPESFCWHVLVSVMKALAWLHDGSPGVRLVPNPPAEDSFTMDPDPDWQPILHRNIDPNNIFLAHPVQNEWYGYCKLGNYGSLVISGHDHGGDTPRNRARVLSKPLAPPRGQDVPLEQLVQQDAAYSYTYPQQEDQPYTMVSEWRALGEIIQMMMMRPVWDNHLGYVRSRNYRDNLRGLGYSALLKNAVVHLMTLNPDERNPASTATGAGSFRFPRRWCTTSALCSTIYQYFQMWRKSDHPEASKMVIVETQILAQSESDRRRGDHERANAERTHQVLEKQNRLLAKVESTPPKGS